MSECASKEEVVDPTAPVMRNPLSRRVDVGDDDGAGGIGSWHKERRTRRRGFERWQHDRFQGRRGHDFLAAKRRDGIAKRDGLRIGYRVIVAGLNFYTSQHVVFELFRQFGRVISCRLGRDPETQRFVGVAEIVYASEQDAERALRELQGATLDGCALTVSRSGKAFTSGTSSSYGRVTSGTRPFGRGYRGSGRGRRHVQRSEEKPTMESLDKQLDEYMSK